VNYYAGIHAMCRYGDANVHHVLPIAGGEIEKARELRAPAARVHCSTYFFAHSGRSLARKASYALFCQRAPTVFLCVQAMAIHARSYSGEFHVSFLVFTRLHVGTGATSVDSCIERRKARAKLSGCR